MGHQNGPWRVGVIVALVGGALVLTGCETRDDGPPAVAGWAEPGWMAQVRQADEEFQAAMISCYAEFGLEGVRGIGGGTVLMANLADETGQISAGVQARVDAAAEECNARVPLPEHQAWAFDGAAYQRMIELRECIVARGFEVPAPPSEELWKDSEPASAWNPYEAMLGGTGGASLTQDEVATLMTACPQPGPSYYSLAPTGDDD